MLTIKFARLPFKAKKASRYVREAFLALWRWRKVRERGSAGRNSRGVGGGSQHKADADIINSQPVVITIIIYTSPAKQNFLPLAEAAASVIVAVIPAVRLSAALPLRAVAVLPVVGLIKFNAATAAMEVNEGKWLWKSQQTARL